MKIISYSTYHAIAYSSPVAVWVMTNFYIIQDEPVFFSKVGAMTIKILLMAQLLALTLSLARQSLPIGWRDMVTTILIHVAIPFQIYFLVLLTSNNTISIGSLAWIQISLISAGLFFWIIGRTISLVNPNQYTHILTSSTQIVIALLIWNNKDVINYWYIG